MKMHQNGRPPGFVSGLVLWTRDQGFDLVFARRKYLIEAWKFERAAGRGLLS